MPLSYAASIKPRVSRHRIPSAKIGKAPRTVSPRTCGNSGMSRHDDRAAAYCLRTPVPMWWLNSMTLSQTRFTGLSERRLASDLNSIGLRPIFQTRFAERPDVLDGDAVVQRVVGGQDIPPPGAAMPIDSRTPP